jgi:hypothetical protein
VGFRQVEDDEGQQNIVIVEDIVEVVKVVGRRERVSLDGTDGAQEVVVVLCEPVDLCEACWQHASFLAHVPGVQEILVCEAP